MKIELTKISDGFNAADFLGYEPDSVEDLLKEIEMQLECFAGSETVRLAIKKWRQENDIEPHQALYS